MLNTTQHLTSITHQDGAFVCMHTLFSNDFIEILEEVLRDNLKADVGNDKLAGKHSAFETEDHVRKTIAILKFLRSFPQELSEILINEADKELLLIQEAFDAFSYEAAETIITDGLRAWIYQEDDQDTACIEYVLRISTVYNQASLLLKMCSDYYEPISVVYYASKKGGQRDYDLTLKYVYKPEDLTF